MMTMPTPSPLELLATACNSRDFHEACCAADALHAFLSSPAVQALADPATGAAAAVLIAKLLELLELEEKATPGPWEQGEREDWDGDADGAIFNGHAPDLSVVGPEYLQEGYEYNGPVIDTVCRLGYSGHTAHIANLELIVATRNALAEAAKAAKEGCRE